MAKTLREYYGEALVRYGKENEKIIVLDADVSGSTRSALFRDAFPDRHLNVGIAEANMTGMAAGLASVGMIPFVNTFAAFITSCGLLAARTYGSYSKLPIRLVGAYSGMSDAFDGPSHHALDDIAIMRAQPNFEVIVPCDAASTDWAVRHCLESKNPIYLRMSRDVFPNIYPAEESFEIGKGKIVRDGTDVTVFACGLMVGHALTAAETLEKEGISVRVADLFSIKPIDRELILRCAKETNALVTAEEHSVIGGLFGAVSEVLAQEGFPVPVEAVGIRDMHGECGPYRELQAKYGFDADAVAAKVRRVLEKKETFGS